MHGVVHKSHVQLSHIVFNIAVASIHLKEFAVMTPVLVLDSFSVAIVVFSVIDEEEVEKLVTVLLR